MTLISAVYGRNVDPVFDFDKTNKTEMMCSLYGYDDKNCDMSSFAREPLCHQAAVYQALQDAASNFSWRKFSRKEPVTKVTFRKKYGSLPNFYF